jgi:hypothetical protein
MWQKFCCTRNRLKFCKSWGMSVSIVSWLQTGWPGFNLQQRQRILPLACVSRPALRPTQSPIWWVWGVKCSRGVTLTPYHHLVLLRSRMRRCYTSSPPWCLQAVAVLLCFTLHHITDYSFSCRDNLSSCLSCLLHKEHSLCRHMLTCTDIIRIWMWNMKCSL